MNEVLIAFGDAGPAIKALGDGRVGGYLVRFTSADEPDMTGEYFDRHTDFGVKSWPISVPVHYRHGFDPVIGKRRLGFAEVKMDDDGLWLEHQLEIADEHERKVAKLVQMRKAGLSSGALSHLVHRQPAGKAVHLAYWPLGEASFTPDPAAGGGTELRALKSLLDLPSIDDLLEEGFSVKAVLASGLSWDEKSQRVASILAEYDRHAAEKVEARVKEGRVLSDTNYRALESVYASLGELLTRAKPKPKEESQPDEPGATPEDAAAEASSLYAAMVRRQGRTRQLLTGA
jgi:hypothetical protein